MAKVIVNGEVIDLADEMEKGKIELDLLQVEEELENVNLEDTIELRLEDLNDNK